MYPSNYFRCRHIIWLKDFPDTNNNSKVNKVKFIIKLFQIIIIMKKNCKSSFLHYNIGITFYYSHFQVVSLWFTLRIYISTKLSTIYPWKLNFQLESYRNWTSPYIIDVYSIERSTNWKLLPGNLKETKHMAT